MEDLLLWRLYKPWGVMWKRISQLARPPVLLGPGAVSRDSWQEMGRPAKALNHSKALPVDH